MPAPVPATLIQHSARKRWGVYAGVAGVTAAIMIVVGIFAKSSSSTASDAPKATTLAPTTVVEPPKPPEPQAAMVPEVNRVLFACEPLDAHIFQNGQDLGAPPLSVDVPMGQKVTVEVRREGYKSQTIVLDGSEAKTKVKLEKVAVAPRPTPARRPSEPATRPASPSSTSIGGGEIVNPWAK
jgi:hypothetical protein